MQKKRRKKLLDENQDIGFCRGVDIHNNDTRHCAQAYDEKKATTLPLKDSFSALYVKNKCKEAQYLCDDKVVVVFMLDDVFVSDTDAVLDPIVMLGTGASLSLLIQMAKLDHYIL